MTKPEKSFFCFKERRKRVIEILKEKCLELQNGVAIFFADFENDRHLFRQHSSFYYLTGLNEPGAVLLLYFDGREILYLPNYSAKREQWVSSINDSKIADFSEVKQLGKPCIGYSLNPLFSADEYENLLSDLYVFLKKDDIGVFAILNTLNHKNLFPVYCFRFLVSKLDHLKDISFDLSPIIERMRNIKEKCEVLEIQKAISVTSLAHQAVARLIMPDIYESDVQAVIESVFISKGLNAAFPSIVASGKNSTILHYTSKSEKLKKGDLVVVDIGAEAGNYAADLTRTYPVNGKFSVRQKEVYSIVLDAQKYIKSIARAGMYLNNPNEPDKSLQHLAVRFFEEYGLGQYFVHGIGHFLGLDVHDVGSASVPLVFGNVITIEPGIYIPQENIGIRIEDDFLIVEDGSICLSENLQRNVDEIEEMVNKKEKL
ncbi:TPA: hypothetical protein DEO28_02940 [Candidatus Dependentiae bacterium]|nr:MAG: Aminopeptidase P [candidate division TM6 bacterium GW2011_GWE2_31_21]KKP53137.1 MAG: Aminopeptidase P [candidate division TM6 bacterium GW2011_GWF2_33_332]HBS47956.1 hypothetical protein [Candidatus Dependentiae bacterium]HBZ73440.1 hypothetical protein [Candidatus Dependentiae bacterium]